MRNWVLLLAILTAPLRAIASDGNITTSLPEYHASDAQAAVVTPRNLLASERFWPYQVALTTAWRPAGRDQALDPSAPGVLIRVESSGLARVDFGRDGLYEVPIGATDLIASANRIRLGEVEKQAPNFMMAIGPRLIDSSADALKPFPMETLASARGFLCVFADPEAPGFAALAAALASRNANDGVLTILFPQGAHPDARVRERLRSLQWTVPFVYHHLAEPYTRSLLAASSPLPQLLLQTPEGRVLLQSEWREGVSAELTAALSKK